jgi:hypothetical protein
MPTWTLPARRGKIVVYIHKHRARNVGSHVLGAPMPALG